MTTKVWMASSANLSIKLRTQVSIGIGLNLCAIRWCQGSFFKAPGSLLLYHGEGSFQFKWYQRAQPVAARSIYVWSKIYWQVGKLGSSCISSSQWFEVFTLTWMAAPLMCCCFSPGCSGRIFSGSSSSRLRPRLSGWRNHSTVVRSVNNFTVT